MQQAHHTQNPKDLQILEAVEALQNKVDAKQLRQAINTIYMEYANNCEDFQKDVGKDYHNIHTPLIDLFQFLNTLVDLDKQGGVLCEA